MFPAAEYVMTAEIAERHQRIADDFARVGRVTRRSRRKHHPLAHLTHAVRTSARRVRSHAAVAR